MPVSPNLLALLLLAAASVVLAIWQHLRHQNRVAEEEPDF